MNDQSKPLCSGDDVRRMLSAEVVAALTSNQITPAQPRKSEIILQEVQDWDCGVSVAVEKTPAGAPAVTIGGGGGFVSDPAWQLTTIPMTQRMSDGAKPTVTFNLCDDDARRLSG